MTIVDRILDMMSLWSPVGQGFFIFFVLMLCVGLINGTYKFIIALFHGWPPAKKRKEESDVKSHCRPDR